MLYLVFRKNRIGTLHSGKLVLLQASFTTISRYLGANLDKIFEIISQLR